MNLLFKIECFIFEKKKNDKNMKISEARLGKLTMCERLYKRKEKDERKRRNKK